MRATFFALMGGLSMLISVAAYPADEIVSQVIESAIEGGFSELERQVINTYYGEGSQQHSSYDARDNDSDRGKKKTKSKKQKKKKMPPGLAKRDTLPPGLQRQYERNGRLPPGLEKRSLPTDLNSSLPEPHEGLRRVIVDTDVLLVETATGIVRDILYDIVK